MKKEGSKKSKVTEIEKNVSTTLDKIKDSEKEKTDLKSIQLEHVNEVDMGKGQKCYLVQVSTTNVAGYKRVHSLITKKLEESLSSTVILILAKKRVNGKDFRSFVSKKVPRDRTLTSVFDGYLDDIIFPATIVGKRIRYPTGKIRSYKVFVDPLDKEVVEDKLPAIIACYKALTNRKLEVEF